MAGIRAKNMIYDVGNYCRLSKDDGTDNESASIATQKSILTDYVKKQGCIGKRILFKYCGSDRSELYYG